MSAAQPTQLPSPAPATTREPQQVSQQPLPRRLRRILSLEDFERAARRHLPRPILAYVSGGVEDNKSLRDNRAAFDEYGFVPRVLVNVAMRSQAVTLLGHTWSAPFGIAPMGISALSAYRGDLVLAREAAAANVPMIISGSSLIRMEDIHAESNTAWFQAYLPGDVPRMTALIERVAQAGFATLVVTVDTQVSANRENNTRAGFTSPLRPSIRLAWDGVIRPRWLFGTFVRTLLRHGMPHFENNFAARGAPILSANAIRDYADRGHLNWEHFEMIRRQWKGTLVVKGILAAEDARIAREKGADGIIVSNHGGRQLDCAVSPLRVLPEIVAACREVPVMMDSGIRRGTDVLKALALGAKFVFVGRPFNYAAAIGSAAGVRHAIGILSAEINRDMGMLGVSSLDQLNPGRLRRVHAGHS